MANLKEKKKANPFVAFVAGGFGGVCNVLSGHPLDTIKVRLQTMPLPDPGSPPLYSGAFDCAYKIVKNEGFLGLYRGMSAPLTGVAPIFAMCFAGYNLGKYLQQSNKNTELTNKQLFQAGAFAGLFSSIITVPGERVKCLLQVQNERKYKGLLDTFNKLYAEGGLRSVYRGGCLTLVRDIPANGCYFLVYEIIQKQIKLRTHSHEVNMFGTIFAGGMAGITYWVVGMPVDVLKSRIQTASEEEYKQGVRGVLRTLLTKQGPSSLFRGVGPVMLRAFPANAACFFGIELATKYLNKALRKYPSKVEEEVPQEPLYDKPLTTSTALEKEEEEEQNGGKIQF